MYKLSVAFFVLFFSMTTFVAAAPTGTGHTIVPFRKRADGYQQLANSLRKRGNPSLHPDRYSGQSRMQGKMTQGRMTQGRMTQGHMTQGHMMQGHMKHNTATVNRKVPVNPLTNKAKVVQKYCSDHVGECKKAIGEDLTLGQLYEGETAGSADQRLEQITVQQKAINWCKAHPDDCRMVMD